MSPGALTRAVVRDFSLDRNDLAPFSGVATDADALFPDRVPARMSASISAGPSSTRA